MAALKKNPRDLRSLVSVMTAHARMDGRSERNHGQCCQHMTIASDVTEISSSDMKACNFIITINFEPNSILTTIGESAFRGLNIQEIYFPSSLLTIEYQAFYNCQSLKTLGFDLATNLETIGENAFTYSGVWDIDLSLATNLKTIDYAAFAKSKIEHLAFPRRLVTIEESCFEQCRSLKSLNFNQAHSLVVIGDACFAGCSMLTQAIVFPPSLEQIQTSAFRSCPIQGVVIPACSKLTVIGNSAFLGCSELVRFEIEAGGTVIDFGSLAFSNCVALAFFSCYFDSKFGNIALFNHKIETVVFHGSLTESNPALTYISSLDYPAKPVFLVPRGCFIDDLTVATLEFYNPAPNPCIPTQQLPMIAEESICLFLIELVTVIL